MEVCIDSVESAKHAELGGSVAGKNELITLKKHLVVVVMQRMQFIIM